MMSRTITSGSLLVFTISAVIVTAMSFQYSDLRILKDCFPRDSCHVKDYNNSALASISCSCDDRCGIYDDCCLDSEYHDDSKNRKTSLDFVCERLNADDSVYMKTTCGIEWNDPVVSQLCRNGSPQLNDENDPMANLPVTSSDTNNTYLNFYCAICNNDAKSLTFWNIGLDCGSDDLARNFSDDYLRNHIEQGESGWGVNVTRPNDGVWEFKTCSLQSVMPDELQSVVRNCTKSISSCSGEWKDAEVEKLCNSYTAVVYGREEFKNFTYRNVHCALCNFVGLSYTDCQGPLARNGLRHDISPRSFAILFDFYDVSGGNVVGSVSPCNKTEIWDPFFRICRAVFCGDNQIFLFDRCVDVDSEGTLTPDLSVTPTTVSSTYKPIIFPTEHDRSRVIFPDEINSTSVYVPTVAPVLQSTLSARGTAMSSNSTDGILVCPKVFLDYDQYTIDDNGTIHIQEYSRYYSQEEYQLSGDGVFVCAPLADTSKFSPALVWVSLVGVLLSCLCLVVHLIAFIMVPDLRNLSGRNLASLCLALLASYVTFIMYMIITPDVTGCKVMASVLYYCLLAVFCWMNTTAFDIWYTFKLTKTELRTSSGKQWHRFVAYSLYSWLLPLAAVALLVGIDNGRPEGIPENLLPYLGIPLCWINQRMALLVFFALPITVMIIVNCAFFISTARIIAETTMATSNSTSSGHHKNQFKMHMRLAVLMGFTWLTGTAAGYLQSNILWYSFVVLNTLQGVFIFLAFTCRRKVWRVMGVTSHKILQRGSSWISHQMGRTNAQAMELKNSSSPATSMDGL